MTVDTDSGFQLEAGDLALLENDEYFYGQGFYLDTLGADADMGNPEPTEATISSLMRDGDLTQTTRYGNRIASFLHQITGNSTQALNNGEAVLEGQLDRMNTLAWRPPDAPATVFEVVRSWSMERFDVDWDLDVVMRKKRIYQCFYECEPFGRSEFPFTIAWTSPYATVATSNVSGSNYKTAVFTARRYLRLRVTNGLTAVAINDVAIPVALCGLVIENGGVGPQRIYHVPTSAWLGGDVEVTFTAIGGATHAQAVNYPNRKDGATPTGWDVLDLGGTARTPIKITTVGGSAETFIYTAPDPNEALHAGFPEMTFSRFTAAGLPGYADGEWATTIDVTDGQPPALHPDGVWPALQSVIDIGGAQDTINFTYPADLQAQVSMFDATGITVISPDSRLSMGYHPAALASMPHTGHPAMGFGAYDKNGSAIPSTITGYKRWKHNAREDH